MRTDAREREIKLARLDQRLASVNRAIDAGANGEWYQELASEKTYLEREIARIEEA